MSTSKIDHKELQKRLKEDELQVYLQEFNENARHFYENHGRQTLFAIGAVAIALIAWNLWSMKLQNDHTAAQASFAAGMALAEQEQFEPALEQFNTLLQSQPDSEVAPYARVMRGHCLVEMGEYDRALQEFQQALPEAASEADAALIRLAIAQTHRSLGNPSAALNEIEALEQQADSDDFKQQLLYLKGACLEEMGDAEKAIETYSSIEDDSAWYGLAQERLEWLEAEPVGTI